MVKLVVRPVVHSSGVVTARRLAVAVALGLGVCAAIAAETNDAGTLRLISRLGDQPARWVSADGRLVAFGAGRIWRLSDNGEAITAFGELVAPADEAVLARGFLFLDEGARVSVLDLEAVSEGPRPLDLDLGANHELRLARSHDFLLVLEQGVGLHVVLLPAPPGHRRAGVGADHGTPAPLTEVSFLPFVERVTAMSGVAGVAHLALESGGLALVDLTEPHAPRVQGAAPLPGPSVALAANGSNVYALGGGALRIIDVARGAGAWAAVAHTGVDGHGLALRGRVFHVAEGDAGLATYREMSPAALTHFVTASNFDFNPQDITISVGDTVEWNNTGGTHDTDSCNVGQTGCSSASTEVWDSGAPSSAPWTYSHTFTLVGPNPYTCTLHAGIGMVGSVTVNAAPPPPPAVPDGSASTQPVTVRRLDSSGSSLEVHFDDASCANAGGVQIVGGRETDLPSTPGGAFAVTTSRCSCATTSPCTWTTAPNPPPGGMIWFVVLATNPSTTEGSWGLDSTGAERRGPGADGASGQCGVTTKDVTNSCGV